MTPKEHLELLEVMRDVDLPWLGAAERAVLLVLVMHAVGNDEPYPSQDRTAKITGFSPRRVWTAYRTLVDHEVLVVVERGRQHAPTKYSVATVVERLRLALGASLSTASHAPGACLNDSRAAPGASLGAETSVAPGAALSVQARSGGQSDSQFGAPRPAPVANESLGSDPENREGERSPAQGTFPIDDADDAFGMPDAWALPAETRAAVVMIGLQDPEAAWTKFCAYQLAKGELHTRRAWLALFVGKWAIDERRHESRARGGPRRPGVQPIAPVSAWKMGDDFGEVVETAHVARSKP